MGPVRSEAEGREEWRLGAEVARRCYNFSFVMEAIKAEKRLTMEGEERRTKGNPAR
jgi:hypothetical protein